MRLHHDDENEAFRAELVAWLDEHPPSAEDSATPSCPARTCPVGRALAAHVVRRRLAGARLAPERGGRNATAVAAADLLRGISDQRDAAGCNPQGLRSSAVDPRPRHPGPDRSLRPPVPARRDHVALGMSEPGAGSDLAGPRTTGGARRRPLRRQRPEGVDVRSAARRLVPLLRAHRPGRAQARGHLRPDDRHASPGITVARCPNSPTPTTPTSTRSSSTTSSSRPSNSSAR